MNPDYCCKLLIANGQQRISYNCVLFSYSQGRAECGGIASPVLSKEKQRGRS